MAGDRLTLHQLQSANYETIEFADLKNAPSWNASLAETGVLENGVTKNVSLAREGPFTLLAVQRDTLEPKLATTYYVLTEDKSRGFRIRATDGMAWKHGEIPEAKDVTALWEIANACDEALAYKSTPTTPGKSLPKLAAGALRGPSGTGA